MEGNSNLKPIIEETQQGNKYFVSLAAKKTLKSKNHEPDFILSIEGEKILIPTIGIMGLIEKIHYPNEFNGRLIGKGSEGKVYEYSIADKKFAVKLFDPEAQKKADKWGRLTRSNFGKPNFLETFRYTEEATVLLASLPLGSLKISPLKEYAAAADFLIMELSFGFTLLDLYTAFTHRYFANIDEFAKCKAKKHKMNASELKKVYKLQQMFELNNAIVISEEIKLFIAQQGITLNHIESSMQDLEDMSNIAYLLEQNEIPPFNSKKCDINMVNFLIESRDAKTNKLNARTIDLGTQIPQTGVEDLDGSFENAERKKYGQIYEKYMHSERFREIIEQKRVKAPAQIQHFPRRTISIFQL